MQEVKEYYFAIILVKICFLHSIFYHQKPLSPENTLD